MTESDKINLTRPSNGQGENFVHPAIWDDGNFQNLPPKEKLIILIFLMNPRSISWSGTVMEAVIGEPVTEDLMISLMSHRLPWFKYEYLSTPHGAPAPADQEEAG